MRSTPRLARPGLGFTRNAAALRNVQTLVVCAVVTVLLTRLTLAQTGYPKVGGSHLHIAHVLWGGLLMVLALMLQLSLMGPHLRGFGAVVGGTGFGLFIDEVGKFVSNTSSYFYHPAVAIIYATFVVAVVAAQLLLPSERMRAVDLLANAARTASEGLHYGLTARERERAHRYAWSAYGSPRYEAVVAMIDTCPVRKPLLPVGSALSGGWGRIRRHLQARAWPWAVVIAALAGQTLVGIAVLALLADGPTEAEYHAVDTSLPALSLAAGLALTLAGLPLLRRNSLSAYRLFRASLLVNILVTQVFVFAEMQFMALYALGLHLAAFWIIGVKIAKLRDTRPEPVPFWAAEPAADRTAAAG